MKLFPLTFTSGKFLEKYVKTPSCLNERFILDLLEPVYLVPLRLYRAAFRQFSCKISFRFPDITTVSKRYGILDTGGGGSIKDMPDKLSGLLLTACQCRPNMTLENKL